MLIWHVDLKLQLTLESSIEKDEAGAYCTVLRIPVIADEVLSEDDEVLFPVGLRIFCGKGQRLCTSLRLSFLVYIRPVVPALPDFLSLWLQK